MHSIVPRNQFVGVFVAIPDLHNFFSESDFETMQTVCAIDS